MRRKRKRVLQLNVPGPLTDKEASQIDKWLRSRLALAGHPNVELIILSGGMKLSEILAPHPKPPKASDEAAAEIGEAIYQRLVNGGTEVGSAADPDG